tara:strand:+ start:939 stop:2246 length:1308 start_codon:yes stop_codon:yes gene_type:complete
MNKVTGINLDKQSLKSSAQVLNYKVVGEKNAVFSLQVKDSSSPNKFYNFITDTFTSTFTSENTLQNISIDSSYVDGSIKIPAASSGAEYRFLVLADPFFNSKTTGQNSFLLTKDITQQADVTVRFSTASDQATTTSYVGLGTNVGSTSGSAKQKAGNIVTITDYEIKDSEGAFHGYKFDFDVNTKTMKVADSLQPIDSDFFTKIATQTNGSGTNSTSMTLDSVDNLVVGMSLVSIADSSDLEQTGSLGVLTFPTITAINTDTKTVTLSAAPSFGDDKAVVFRAYGSDLITQSTGGVFEFNNFKVEPASRLAASGGKFIALGKAKPLGHFVINGTMGSAGTTLTIDDLNGASSGARIFGPRVDTSGDNNLISSINVAGTSVVVGGNQQLSDNTVINVLGAAPIAFISGNITIATFPSISTDIFYDIDRAIVLSTLS